MCQKTWVRTSPRSLLSGHVGGYRCCARPLALCWTRSPGTGTTAQVAHALGCHGVGVDLSDTYCRIGADERVVARRAARVKNTPTPLTANPTQGDLLDLFTEAV